MDVSYEFLIALALTVFIVGFAAGAASMRGSRPKGIPVGGLLMLLFGFLIGYFLSPQATEGINAVDRFIKDLTAIPTIVIAVGVLIILFLDLSIYAKVSRIIK